MNREMGRRMWPGSVGTGEGAGAPCYSLALASEVSGTDSPASELQGTDQGSGFFSWP